MFCVVLLSVLAACFADEKDTHCSKYDFEERVLEKMVRIEFQMEREKTVSDVFQEVLNIKKQYEEAVKDMATLKKDIVDRVEVLEEQVNNTVQEKIMELKSAAANIKRPSVAFRASLTQRTTVRTNAMIVFPRVLLNEGQGYDSRTGIFTVPVKGTYIFSVTLCPYKDKYVVYSITVDNVQQNTETTYGAEGHPCYSSDTNLVLSVNQRVGVQVLYESGSQYQLDHNSYRWHVFSGTLVNV